MSQTLPQLQMDTGSTHAETGEPVSGFFQLSLLSCDLTSMSLSFLISKSEIKTALVSTGDNAHKHLAQCQAQRPGSSQLCLPGGQLSARDTRWWADPSLSREHPRGPALWSPECQVPVAAAGHWRQEGLPRRGWAGGWRDLVGGPTPPHPGLAPPHPLMCGHQWNAGAAFLGLQSGDRTEDHNSTQFLPVRPSWYVHDSFDAHTNSHHLCSCR